MLDSSQIKVSFIFRRPKALCKTVLRYKEITSLEGPMQYVSYQIEVSFLLKRPYATCKTVLRSKQVTSLEGPKQCVGQFSDRSNFLLQKALSRMSDSSQIEGNSFSRRP